MSAAAEGPSSSPQPSTPPPESPSRASRRRLPRRAVGCGVALLALLVLLGAGYFLAARWFLDPEVGPDLLSNHPDRLQVSWEGAELSWIPGRVRLDRFVIRGQDHQQRWQVEVEEAVTDVDLLELARRRFRTRRIDAREARFQLARFEDSPADGAGGSSGSSDSSDSASESSSENLTPTIPGFEDHGRPAPRDRSAPERQPWRIELDDIHVHRLGEVWIDAYRFAGEGEVLGDLFLEAKGGEVRLDDARLEGVRGTLGLGRGGPALIDGLELGARCAISPFVSRETRGAAVLDHISGRVRLSGTVTGLGFLERYLGSVRGLDLTGRGPLEADVHLEGGVLASPTQLAFQAEEFTVQLLGSRAVGPGRLTARVTGATGSGAEGSGTGDAGSGDSEEDGSGKGEAGSGEAGSGEAGSGEAGSGEAGDGEAGSGGEGQEGRADDESPRERLEIEARFPRFEVALAGSGSGAGSGAGSGSGSGSGGSPYARGQDLSLRAVTPALDLVSPDPRPVEVAVDLPDSELLDLTVYNAFLPADSQFRITSGTGRLEAHLELEAPGNRGHGRVKLSSKGFSGRVGGTAIVGDLTLDGRVPTLDLRQRWFSVGGTSAELAGVVPEEGDEDATPWWAKVRVEDGRIAMEEGAGARLDSRIALRVESPKPLLALFVSNSTAARWLNRLLDLEDLTATGRVETRPGLVRIEDLRVTGEDLRLKSRLRFLGEDRRAGILFVEYEGIAAGFELEEDGGVVLHLRHSEEWFREAGGF